MAHESKCSVRTYRRRYTLIEAGNFGETQVKLDKKFKIVSFLFAL